MECARKDARSWRGNGIRVFLIFLLCFATTWAEAQTAGAAKGKAQVYYAMDNTALQPGQTVSRSVVRRMVDSVVCRVANTRTVAEAWKRFISPEDTVGIKVSGSGRNVSGTHPAVVEAIAEGLIEAGIPASRIIVWDRNLDDLLVAGYRQDGRLYQLKGINVQNGYDPEAIVTAPIIGKLIWGDSQFGKKDGKRMVDVLRSGDELSSRSFFAKILTREVTKVINVPSLMDSYQTGIHGGIVNMTLMNLDNWRRFAQAAGEGDSYLGEVYADPMINDKVVLTILDALILQYAGGPFPNPNFCVNNFSIFASRDVVAIDSTAVRLIDEIRVANKMPSIKSKTLWLDAANQLGLGEYRDSRIETIRVGVEAFQ